MNRLVNWSSGDFRSLEYCVLRQRVCGCTVCGTLTVMRITTSNDVYLQKGGGEHPPTLISGKYCIRGHGNNYTNICTIPTQSDIHCRSSQGRGESVIETVLVDECTCFSFLQ